ncbi:MAG: hypothetical protein WCC53_11925 [Thermoanaerobaculia bacterium]
MKRLPGWLALAGLVAFIPAPAFAQAYTLPQGVGGVTLLTQYYDDTGRRFTDGTRLSTGQTDTVTVLLEADYGVTDRLSATLGIPYIFAKYRGGAFPPFLSPETSTDSCHCWHSTFQDFSVSARYRLGDDPWAITPVVKYINPSHDYNYQAEAVVGFDRREFAVGVNASLRLAGFLPKASIEAGYTYSFVERFLGIPNDRSNGSVEIDYAVTRRLHLQATGAWQYTHGGLRLGSPSGDPFYPPGELSILNTPASLAEFHRLFRNNYWQAGGGISYSIGSFDVFASFTKYVWGTDTHDGQAYTVGATLYFGGTK